MNYLTLENISKSYGEKILFENLSLRINKGEKVALIAKNGTGKSTLLRVIAGLEAPEGENAKIQLKTDIRVGYLEQEPDFRGEHTILEAVLDADNELMRTVRAYEEAMILTPDDTDKIQTLLAKMDDLKAWDFEAQVKEVLFKLNLTQLNQKVSVLSGGQKKRLALAKIIVEKPDFLILDEPTNHIDLSMIEWLEKYLQQSGITLFMVTHDRYFLQLVCNRIVELDKGKIYNYSGNYSDFIEKKALRFENELAQFDKNKKLYKKELNWVRRMPKARGTKAKSRVDKFYEIKEKTYNKPTNEEIKIDVKPARLGSKILEMHYVSKGYGDLKLIEDFHYKFKKKERIGIVGKNGAGKTTFLQLLTQEIKPDAGKIVLGTTVEFGYYKQEGIQLDADKRVIEVITDIAEYIPLEKGQKLTAAALLERFMFNRKHQQVYVSQLSGGERRRLYLLSVLMKNPNFLILDEPTNDLDVVTLNVLENFLMDFPGCLVVVSHDRFFMEKLVDHLFIFEGNGKIKDFNGKYADYRKLLAAREKEQRKEEKAKKEIKKTASGNQPQTTLTYEQRKELSRLEKQIEKLEKQKAAIVEKFNDTNLSTEDITNLSKELKAVEELLEEKEMAWLELGDLG